MKKTFLFSLLLFIFINKNKAQISISINAGSSVFNTQRISPKINVQDKLSVSPFVGLIFSKKLNNQFEIETELQYVQRGNYFLQLHTECFSTEVYGKASYFVIQPKISYIVSDWISLRSGLDFGFKTSEKYYYSSFILDQIKADDNSSYYKINALNSLDFGASIGIVFKLDKINASIIYSRSLISTLKQPYKNEEFSYYSDKNTKYFNQSLQIGLEIPLKTFKKNAVLQ